MEECYGAVEALIDGVWGWAINIHALLVGESDLVGSLFGVSNLGGFRAPFEGRGLPPDTSLDFLRLIDDLRTAGSEVRGASYATHDEILKIDWNEAAVEADARIHRFRMDPLGNVSFAGKALHYPELGSEAPTMQHPITIGGYVYRRVRLCRRDLLVDSRFSLLLSLSQTLAGALGSDSVRWSVVFAS